MGFVLYAAEAFTIFWFVVFVGMVRNHWRETRHLPVYGNDPVERAVIGGAKWVFALGYGVYMGVALVLTAILIGLL